MVYACLRLFDHPDLTTWMVK